MPEDIDPETLAELRKRFSDESIEDIYRIAREIDVSPEEVVTRLLNPGLECGSMN